MCRRQIISFYNTAHPHSGRNEAWDKNEIIWDVARSAPNASEADEVLYIGKDKSAY